ncbi:hypothetical protein BH10ACI4_BH10ACI4_23140 [soil metagenome]
MNENSARNPPELRRFSKAWTRGGLTWREIGKELWRRTLEHNLPDRAGLLSFYFLLAFFPLLILLSALVGILLASQSETYWRLLDYMVRLMPNSAFVLFTNVLREIRTGATGGKISLSLVLTLWTASSGVAALIEALNVAFHVQVARPWWHRRLVAVTLTLGIGAVLAASLLFLFLTSSVGVFMVAKLPVLGDFPVVSTLVRWFVDSVLLFASLMLIYAFGPNIKRKRIQGIIPGACLALISWAAASWGLRMYLAVFGNLSHSYGSLAGVIALLFWLYTAAAAILVGGELNAIIWHKTNPGPLDASWGNRS